VLTITLRFIIICIMDMGSVLHAIYINIREEIHNNKDNVIIV